MTVMKLDLTWTILLERMRNQSNRNFFWKYFPAVSMYNIVCRDDTFIADLNKESKISKETNGKQR